MAKQNIVVRVRVSVSVEQIKLKLKKKTKKKNTALANGVCILGSKKHILPDQISVK